MCELYLPQHDIQKIYYFTAKVSGTQNDPDKPQRQLSYIRALMTTPGFSVIDGHFIKEEIELPLADGSGLAKVIRAKEKKSDVNLVSQLFWDAHCNNFESAVLVTGDSDFHTPVLMIRHYFKKEIGILDPQKNGSRTSPMNQAATFYKPIRGGVLRDSQFPNEVMDAKGSIHKPTEWYSQQN